MGSCFPPPGNHPSEERPLGGNLPRLQCTYAPPNQATTMVSITISTYNTALSVSHATRMFHKTNIGAAKRRKLYYDHCKTSLHLMKILEINELAVILESCLRRAQVYFTTASFSRQPFFK